MNSAPFSSGNHPQRPTLFLIGLVLTASLCTEIKIPVIGVGLQNLVIPAAGIAIIFQHRRNLRQVCGRSRSVLMGIAAFSTWTMVACFLSPWPAASLHYWLKYHLLGIGFLAFLVLFSDPVRVTPALKVVLAFLAFLAVFGLFETFFPDSILFFVFRSSASLSIQPRAASLMAWPNQFGVLMASGVVLAQIAHIRGILKAGTSAILTLLFLTQVAQSGSRNAWLVLIAGLLWMAVRQQITPRRAAGLTAVFLIIVAALPVSSRQTGLWDDPSQARVQSSPDSGQTRSTSLSPPALSLSLRSELWRAALSEIRARPISGLGFGAFELVVGPKVMGRQGFNAHNLALNLAVEVGLVGLVLAVWAGWQLLRSRQKGGRVFEAALVIALASQFLDCFLYDATFMTVFFLLAAGLTSPDPKP